MPQACEFIPFLGHRELSRELITPRYDSLSHLVGFALKLRNLGVPDHGLIKELSSPLAGSLYTGEGHSRLYDDESVYQYALQPPLSFP